MSEETKPPKPMKKVSFRVWIIGWSAAIGGILGVIVATIAVWNGLQSIAKANHEQAVAKQAEVQASNEKMISDAIAEDHRHSEEKVRAERSTETDGIARATRDDLKKLHNEFQAMRIDMNALLKKNNLVPHPIPVDDNTAAMGTP